MWFHCCLQASCCSFDLGIPLDATIWFAPTFVSRIHVNHIAIHQSFVDRISRFQHRKYTLLFPTHSSLFLYGKCTFVRNCWEMHISFLIIVTIIQRCIALHTGFYMQVLGYQWFLRNSVTNGHHGTLHPFWLCIILSSSSSFSFIF
eukprot:218539_1